MTLYLWIHWFWVTALCDCGAVGDVTTIYSVSSDISQLSEFKVHSTSSATRKEPGSIFATPASYVNPSNGSLTISVQKYTKLRLQKSASKKYDGAQKLSIYNNVSENSPLREVPVINLNISKKFDDWSEKQINSTFGNMNLSNSDIMYFGNDTSSNHSQLLNSEQIGMEESEKGSFSAAGITGISLGCVVVVGILCSVSYFLYHNRGFNKPQVLNDHCSNHDSSGYLDDASVRDNSEEMYSLDNDSFLNSLEAMTIQNYWTDTVKHTKL